MNIYYKICPSTYIINNTDNDIINVYIPYRYSNKKNYIKIRKDEYSDISNILDKYENNKYIKFLKTLHGIDLSKYEPELKLLISKFDILDPKIMSLINYKMNGNPLILAHNEKTLLE